MKCAGRAATNVGRRGPPGLRGAWQNLDFQPAVGFLGTFQFVCIYRVLADRGVDIAGINKNPGRSARPLSPREEGKLSKPEDEAAEAGQEPTKVAKPRRRILLGGVISFGDGTHTIDCAIRNVSAKGAKITCKKADQLPQDFYLINVRDRIVYKAKLVWRTGHDAGLKFAETMRFSEITDPSLSHLADSWMSRAIR